MKRLLKYPAQKSEQSRVFWHRNASLQFTLVKYSKVKYSKVKYSKAEYKGN